MILEHLDLVSLVFGALAIPLFAILLKVPAPYGRYARSGWGPLLSRRFGFFFMELPASVIFAIVFFVEQAWKKEVAIVFFIMWQSHYAHRAFIYPWSLSSSKSVPLLVVFMGATFNIINASLQALALFATTRCDNASWLADARFLVGLFIFVGGYLLNRHADSTLGHLRRQGKYLLPQGFAFKYISCPNYFGEIVQWVGWAFATWTVAGLAFAAWTFANLAPRALSHHRWYLQHFPDYPRSRKALIPWLL